DSDQLDDDAASCARNADTWASFVQKSVDAGIVHVQADNTLLPVGRDLWDVFVAISDPFGSGVWKAATDYFNSVVGRSAVKSCKGKYGVAKSLQQAASEPCRGMPRAKLLHLVELSVDRKLLVQKPDNKSEVANGAPVRTPV